MKTLLEQFERLPRVGKWSIAGVGALGLYFGGFEPSVDQAANLSSRADTTESALLEWTGGSSTRKGDVDTVSHGIQLFGAVEPPGPESERSQLLLSRLSEVLKSHKVSEYTVRERSLTLKQGPLTALTPAHARIKRVVRDVAFECSQDTLPLIVADLEKSSEVSAVSRLYVLKTSSTSRRDSSPARSLTVTLSVETWGVAREGAPS